MFKRLTFLTTGRSAFGGRARLWWAAFIEAIFGALLLVLGVVLLASFITLAVIYSSPSELYVSVWSFALQLIVAVALIAIGGYQMISTAWQTGASAERRGAIVSRAGEIELLNELRTGRENLPNVPSDKYPPVRGEKLRFRLFGSRRNTWGILTTALLTMLFAPLAVVLTLTTFADIQQGWVDWLGIGLSVAITLAAFWSIYQFFRQWMRITGVGSPALEISRYPIVPGKKVELHLSQPGKVRLNLLDITIVCEEEATYNQGTDIRTERNVVFSERLLRRRGIKLSPDEAFEETIELSLPTDAMHSFQSANNRVQWKIIVQGNARGWPRQERSFAISVVPSPAPESA